VLPKGFRRIRHYGLFASSNRAETIKAVRKLLNQAPPAAEQTSEDEMWELMGQPLSNDLGQRNALRPQKM
jgi:hypothetical protein